MRLKKKSIFLIVIIVLVLLTISYGVAKIYAYNSEVFKFAKEYLSDQEEVVSYFGDDANIDYSITEYNIWRRATISNARFLLNLEDASKSLDVHIEVSKKLQWKVDSVEYKQID